MIVIETGRLELFEMDENDAEFILRLVNEPAFLRYIGDRGVRSIEDARRYIADGPVAGYGRYGHGLLRVARKADGVPVGMCGVLKRDTLPDPDLGFSFLPEHWSQGYAFESADAVMKHAREALGLGRILAITTIDNGPSIRLLGKVGFRFDRMITVGDDPTELRQFVSEP
ncbi:MAG TPA: GNAT family N-acetyltransferase [Steroidobacteraceae bacterium]